MAAKMKASRRQHQDMAPRVVESGADWRIEHDPQTRDYAAFVHNTNYLGSRKTTHRGRGRPSKYADTYVRPRDDALSVAHLCQRARQARAELDSLPPKVRADTIARVCLILSSEDQARRTTPSPLARIARCVYGIDLPWLAPAFEVRIEE